jgi:hypothetical protein
MLRIDPSDELMDAIVRAVAKQPGLSAADLHKAVGGPKVVTIQHLYRKVKQLVAQEVLIKREGVLTLNLLWLSYLGVFVSDAKQALSQHPAIVSFPLKKGERLSFSVRTMNDVQTLWHHLLVQLHRSAPQKHLYKYYSHAWWVWNQRTLDVEFYRKILTSGVRCLWLYGGNTFLDRAAVQQYPDLLESRIVLDVPFPAEGYNLNVYGDYVFECTLPPHIARHLAFVFSSLASAAREDLVMLDDIMQMEADFTITVWHNPTLAAKLQRDMGKYFLFGARVMPDEGARRE